MMKNETDMRKVLAALLEDAPYPVYREDTVAFVRNNYDKLTRHMQKDVADFLEPGCSAGGAAFVNITLVNAKRIGRPMRFFLLEADDKPEQHVYYMLHEFGHYSCAMKKCYCVKSNKEAIEEFHADRYALEQLLKMGWLPALGAAVRHIKNYDIYAPLSSRDKYTLAARRLMKSELWERVMRANFSRPEFAEIVKNLNAIEISRGGKQPPTLLWLNGEPKAN